MVKVINEYAWPTTYFPTEDPEQVCTERLGVVGLSTVLTVLLWFLSDLSWYSNMC